MYPKLKNKIVISHVNLINIINLILIKILIICLCSMAFNQQLGTWLIYHIVYEWFCPISTAVFATNQSLFFDVLALTLLLISSLVGLGSVL